MDILLNIDPSEVERGGTIYVTAAIANWDLWYSYYVDYAEIKFYLRAGRWINILLNTTTMQVDRYVPYTLGWFYILNNEEVQLPDNMPSGTYEVWVYIHYSDFEGWTHICNYASLKVLGRQFPVPTELKYDDGDPETRIYGSTPGDMILNKFTAGGSRTRITKAKIHLCEDPWVDFTLVILDSNREFIYTRNVSPEGTGWLILDLKEERVFVEGGEDFYVGVKWMTGGMPLFGCDESSPDGKSWSYDVDTGTWNLWSDLDFMIRVEVTSRS